jgi:hypothetical protein
VSTVRVGHPSGPRSLSIITSQLVPIEQSGSNGMASALSSRKRSGPSLHPFGRSTRKVTLSRQVQPLDRAYVELEWLVHRDGHGNIHGGL